MPIALASLAEIDADAMEAEAARFQRIADRRLPLLLTTIQGILTDARADASPDLIVRGIEHADWISVDEGIPQLVGRVKLVKADEPPLDEQLADAFGAGGEYALRLVPSFDLVDQAAVQFARERAGKLLTDLDGYALQNARRAAAFGIEHGRTVQQTARFIEQTLYLPPRAMQAVENYFLGMIERVEKGEDLQEAARFLARNRALAPRKFLDAQNIDTLVGRYAERWVRYTAETIARTLTIEASNAGLRDGWEQAARGGFFDRAQAEVVWMATGDDRVCPECASLNGITVAFSDGTWETSAGNVGYPPAHPACRCTIVLITASAESLGTRAA